MMRTIHNIIRVALIAVAMMIGGKAWGQTTVEIGTGTSTTYYPMPGLYGWQYDVYLYTPSAASFLNSACTISSIAFKVSSNSTTTGAQMTVWVKDVDLTTLSSSSTFSSFTSEATQVYHNTSLSTSSGWNTLSFGTGSGSSSSFSHQAGKALLVAVRGVGCTTSGGCSRSCYYTSASSTHWYKHVDSSDPGTSTTGTSVDAYRSNIQVTYTGGSGGSGSGGSGSENCEDFSSTTATTNATGSSYTTYWRNCKSREYC